MAIFEPFPYYPATVTAVRQENVRTKTFVIDVATPWKFRAGHHCVIRLTDERGYIAARDYSITSAPTSGSIEFSVLLAKGGEVSTWLHERIRVGDTLQISKPLGSDFTWDAGSNDPVLLLAGGIGIAPLVSILREHRLQSSSSPIHVAYSVRTQEDVCFANDLKPQNTAEKIELWFSRSATKTPGSHSGRIDTTGLAGLLLPVQRTYICGPTSFVDEMEKLLHFELGVPAEMILTERFG